MNHILIIKCLSNKLVGTNPSGCHSLAVRSREADSIQFSLVVATHRTSIECPVKIALNLYSGIAIGIPNFSQSTQKSDFRNNRGGQIKLSNHVKLTLTYLFFKY